MRFLAARVLAATSVLVACSGEKPAPSPSRPPGADQGTAGPGALASGDGPIGPPAPASWDRPVTAPSDEEAASTRAACGYGAGALPAETQGASHPMGARIPIDHLVIVMQENRSFDHYFFGLRAHGRDDAELAPEGFTNPDGEGAPVVPFRDRSLCFADTAHSWNATHAEWDGGKMDGFVRANDDGALALGAPPAARSLASGARAMSYYEAADLPFMYWAADEFAIADHYHASLLTSTWPNRMYLYAASSFGRTGNELPDPGHAPTLFDELEMRRVRWRTYATDVPPEAIFVDAFLRYRAARLLPVARFFEDAAAGTLPEVAFVDASDGDQSAFDPAQNDEHPPSVMQVGQAFVAEVARALVRSPGWRRSALVLAYDEHGGLWDHVPPPPACAPDAIAPEDASAGSGFDRLGVRVPFVVISPWARRAFVGHHVYDHTSITRLVEARFTLPAMSARDANAEVPWELFDFAAPREDAPEVPEVPVDEAALSRCAATMR